MEKITMYRYTRPDGGTSVSREKPTDGVKYTESYRLIADEGMLLVSGTKTASCIDTNNPDEWVEIENPIPEEEVRDSRHRRV